ncbi:MAG TPA: cytochrome c [Burkholderiales bacterium]|nr:cytochrome c [Burkholderiales bacterium]
MFALVLAALLVAACGERGQAPSAAPAPASKDAARGLDPTSIARGETVYNAHCAECHGPRGAGLPGDWRKTGPDGKYPPPPLDDSAHAWHHPTEVLRRVIRKGSPPGMGNMPAWAGKLNEREIDDVVAYIKSLWSDEAYARWQQIESQSTTH